MFGFIMLSSFKDHLTQKSLVKEKYVPFYTKWVSDCYSFLNVSDSMILNLEQKMQFLENLAKTHEEWQVKQAGSALRLALFFYVIVHHKERKIPRENKRNLYVFCLLLFTITVIYAFSILNCTPFI